jgi:hypothetical protein
VRCQRSENESVWNSPKEQDGSMSHNPAPSS